MFRKPFEQIHIHALVLTCMAYTQEPPLKVDADVSSGYLNILSGLAKNLRVATYVKINAIFRRTTKPSLGGSRGGTGVWTPTLENHKRI